MPRTHEEIVLARLNDAIKRAKGVEPHSLESNKEIIIKDIQRALDMLNKMPAFAPRTKLDA